MMQQAEALKKVSMVCANFGNGDALADVLKDWIKFAGGRPRELVLVDGGSDEKTQEESWRLYKEKLVDKLQLIQRNHYENHRDTCYYQEHSGPMVASCPYILFFKIDTLAYRQGHENWIAEAMEHLEKPGIFAVSGSFNTMSKHHEAWPGWYWSDKCSLNFSLMKRSTFIAALQEYAGEYIASGFNSVNPGVATNQTRYLMEVAFERYMKNHELYTLVKMEDPTWQVFHTNVIGPRLVEVRKDFLDRKGVVAHLNAGCVAKHPKCDPIRKGVYYGLPRKRWVEFKIAVGASCVGPVWRAVRGMLGMDRKPARAGAK